MKWKVLVVMACVVSVLGATTLFGDPQAEADLSKVSLEKELRVALKSRAESAMAVYKAAESAWHAETVTFETVADASRTLTEHEMASATNSEERIAAARRYLERTAAWAIRIKQLADTGVDTGVGRMDYLLTKRDHESAQIMLLEARIQAKH